MAEPYIGEIKMFGFDYAPRNWALCDGQTLPINENQILYALLGTIYGGDGRTNFALPDFRGRVPVHRGYVYPKPGIRTGVEKVAIQENELPVHTHGFIASTDAADKVTAGSNETRLLAKSDALLYTAPNNLVDMNSDTTTKTGGGQAHENMQPSLVISFAIALQGLFPSRN
jgi:microcystin-dependent protein